MTGKIAPGGWHFAMSHSAPGGLREIWNDIAEGLEARGHATARFVLYPDGLRGDGSDAEAEGWHHLLPERPRGAPGMVSVIRALVGWLRETRPAVVVTAMPLANVVMAIAATLARTGTKVVATHHSPIETHAPAIVRLDTLTGMLPAVAAVVSVSQGVAASLEGKPAAYRARRRTIHNALPQRIEDLLDRLRDQDRSAKVPGRLVALGRLSHQKNYPLLLAALSRMDTGTLDVVGSGEDEAALRAMTHDLDLDGRVAFLGQMGREAALRIASQAEVFVQVSHYEGHSLALIEAARLGLPLVVSDVPVQVEGITANDGERCGQIVPLDEPAALRAVLAKLLADPSERALWSARARRLGLEASNRSMVDAYEALLAGVARR